MTIETVAVADLRAGHVFRNHEDSPWATVLRVKRDGFGFDVNYSRDGRPVGWRGFGNDDSVEVWVEASG